jgi:hypothetical protein
MGTTLLNNLEERITFKMNDLRQNRFEWHNYSIFILNLLRSNQVAFIGEMRLQAFFL